jgi:hypothetical protein
MLLWNQERLGDRPDDGLLEDDCAGWLLQHCPETRLKTSTASMLLKPLKFRVTQVFSVRVLSIRTRRANATRGRPEPELDRAPSVPSSTTAGHTRETTRSWRFCAPRAILL